MSESETLGWQSQVAALTAERGRAETAARVVRRLGGPGDIASAELTYGTGRAEADAVISALIIALQQGKGADDLADLTSRMTQAVAARETLATLAGDLAARAPGEKGVLLDLASQALPSLLSAVGALWTRRSDQDAATRATIAARLEATRWPAFADIATG